jgi:ADP-glucose pyrophosphorylase
MENINMNKDNIISAILCGGTGSRLRPLTYYFQKIYDSNRF